MLKIVLTGGPSAGKSMISARLASDEPGRFVQVPEAATQVYAALNTRWDRIDAVGRRDVQRRIFTLQLEQEAIFEAKYPEHILLLDRGTVDGSAYWPDGPEDYWEKMGTTDAKQLERYFAVLCLQSSAAVGIYDGVGSNPVRHEDAHAAIASGTKLNDVWSGHRRFQMVPAHVNFEEKVLMVHRAIEQLLKGS